MTLGYCCSFRKRRPQWHAPLASCIDVIKWSPLTTASFCSSAVPVAAIVRYPAMRTCTADDVGGACGTGI